MYIKCCLNNGKMLKEETMEKSKANFQHSFN